MRFAALALMAVVLFSDDAEARRGRRRRGRGKKGVSAKCTVTAADPLTDVDGYFKLYQKTKRDGTVKPIHVFGRFENLVDATDYSI